MTGLVVLFVRGLVLLALYAFLGLALWIMWQELRRGSSSVGSASPPIRLEIRSGNGQGVIRQFTQADLILGRNPASDLPLADKAVSAHHAQLQYHHGQWWIRDLGSKNGTRLNRRKVEGPTVLTTGDEIRCGGVKLLVTLPSGLTATGGWEEASNE